MRYIRFCSNILSNGKCLGEGYQCCLQSEVDLENSSNIVTVVQQSDSLNNSKDETKVNDMSVTVSTSHGKDVVATTPMPLCEGTCVAPLFSLLCDETDYSLYCPNGGSCCVNRDPTTEAPPLKPCPGNCIPTILSGMCNRPSELILKTIDCTSGSICCHNPQENNEDIVKDMNIDETSPPKANIPPQLSIPPPNNPMPQNYNPIPFPHENLWPPIHAQEVPIQRPNFNHLPPLPMIPHQNPSLPNIPLNPQSIPNRDILPAPHPSPVPPSLPEPELDQPIDDSSTDNKSIAIGVGGPPFCPGPCIAPMFRFTCFGGNAIYPKFQCAKGGQICCAPMTDIQAFEANVLANNGVWKINPNKTVNYDDSPIKPPPPRRPNPYMCGIKGTQRKETPRVVGGSDSFPGEWCWQAALINAQNQYLCAGALISSQWVLTAAHCITKY
ncbi:unnamed protein product [Oppiella nova]|uniref:Uncharacterized protein n=1 Tax=Oppiella nova TaxID=334625 RepID=A0A7R9M2V7_9ACAR|nr:unnamed protein product [Oppiella nova]CAG2168790.1 unnamed protein product [Oppiella nova]